MERGQVRFTGPTAELAERPDLVRSVFLGEVSANGARGARRRSKLEPAEPTHVGLNGNRPEVFAALEITRRFGGVTALDRVSLQVGQNEILGIIGANGAGKTTLFDVICGQVQPDSGTIWLGQRQLDGLSPEARAAAGLGRSFQDSRLFPALTTAETIAVALELHVPVRDPLAAALRLPAVTGSERWVDGRVNELLDLLGLQALADRFIDELSTGTRRIVDLACLLAQQPRVVLFDEPSAGIAQREAEALAPTLCRLRDEAATSLVVIEHDLRLLTSIADRLIALDLGRVIAEGPPADVLRHPAVIASYLGASDAARP
jgi:branched-chain amino acid transport system ATP-binding protein